MEKLIFFGVLSLPVIVISFKSLLNVKSHGFYRFFSWECIIWLIISNHIFWFEDSFGIKQIISWIFLFFSIYLVVAGILLIKKVGKPDDIRTENTLYRFEKTTELVDTGIYKYIRHPLYSSLLFLTWGVFFKNTTIELFIISLFSTTFLFITAKIDEKECIEYFGSKYIEYKKRSRMFIPFLF
jgi:protein-S-isoprenylcysteine O-methyltransferase Ste14